MELDIHYVGLASGFLGGILLSYEAFAYLRTGTQTLARMEQREEKGYAVYSPPEEEIEREFKEIYVPRVRRRKFIDAIGFVLIVIGFLLELL